MADSLQSSIIEFRTDPVERLVVGVVLVFVGSGALSFWNVEQSMHWPLAMILLIGASFVVLGLFLMGFRRVMRLERKHGVSELRTLFGVKVARWDYPMADFEVVGSHGATTELLTLDVVLFRHGGGHLTLRKMLNDADAKNEITRVAQCLELPAEYEPRMHLYLIGR